MKISICSDHGGFELKEVLVPYLKSCGHEVVDFGTDSKASMDYPDVAFPCAEAVSKGDCERAIVICTSGVGVSMCANKVAGIRCALCWNEKIAELSRRHNNANALALGAAQMSLETAKRIVDVWLSTGFDGDLPEFPRHKQRVEKMMAYKA